MTSYICLKTEEDVHDTTQLAVNFGSDTFKLAVFDDTLTIDPETFTAYGVAPFNAGEASGGGYSAGGSALSGISFAVQSGQQRLRYNTSPLTIANMTANVRNLLHYDDTLAGNNAWYLCDLGAVYALTAEALNIVPQSNGWYRIRA